MPEQSTHDDDLGPGVGWGIRGHVCARCAHVHFVRWPHAVPSPLFLLPPLLVLTSFCRPPPFPPVLLLSSSPRPLLHVLLSLFCRVEATSGCLSPTSSHLHATFGPLALGRQALSGCFSGALAVPPLAPTGGRPEDIRGYPRATPTLLGLGSGLPGASAAASLPALSFPGGPCGTSPLPSFSLAWAGQSGNTGRGGPDS